MLLSDKRVLIHATIWMNVQRIKLSEESQSQKFTYCQIPLSNILEMTKLQRWKTKCGSQRLRKGWGQEGSKCSYKRAIVSDTCMMAMFYILSWSKSISWLWPCITVLEDVILRDNWVKGKRDLSILVLTFACRCIIVSKQKL